MTTKGWRIIGAIALLVATFALGYSLGSRNNQSVIDTPNTLTPADMERAFGNVSPTVHDQPATEQPTAKSLSGLIAGLEQKVAANPENIEQQLLLAQTYNELDDRAKSLKLLHALNQKAPKNSQVKVTLATILMTGSDRQELKQAARLFDEAIKLKPEIAGMARLYQGEINLKLDQLSKQ